jgi:hypothetical protein
MKNAMEGSGAVSVVIPSLVKVSHGDLPLPENISVKLIEGDLLEFTWEVASAFTPASNDQVMMIAYDGLCSFCCR